MTKIEEMARAVWEGARRHWKDQRPNDVTDAWAELPEASRLEGMRQMRDALGVLRVPTEAMIQAGKNYADSWESEPDGFRDGFVAAIDAILAEDPAR